MRKQVFYVQGGDSFNTEEEFLSYLKIKSVRDLPGLVEEKSWKKDLPKDLLGDGYEVFMPSMPNRNNAKYEEWKVWFERYFEYLRDGVVLVGCSLGGMFLAKYLSENVPPFRIKVLYLLAAPSGVWPVQPDGNDCQSFKFTPEAAAEIAKTAEQIEIWHSEDDFVVPVTEADWYKTHIPTAKVVIFKDKNHFLVPELPELVAAIKALP